MNAKRMKATLLTAIIILSIIALIVPMPTLSAQPEVVEIIVGTWKHIDTAEDERYVEALKGENVLFWNDGTQLRRATYTWDGTTLTLDTATSPSGLTYSSGINDPHNVFMTPNVLNQFGGNLEAYFQPRGGTANGVFHATSMDNGASWTLDLPLAGIHPTTGESLDGSIILPEDDVGPVTSAYHATGGVQVSGVNAIIEIGGERRLYGENSYGDVMLWTSTEGDNGPFTRTGVLIDNHEDGSPEIETISPSGDAIMLGTGDVVYFYVDGNFYKPWDNEANEGAVGMLLLDADGYDFTYQEHDFVRVDDLDLQAAGLTALEEATINNIEFNGNQMSFLLMLIGANDDPATWDDYGGPDPRTSTDHDIFYAPVTITFSQVVEPSVWIDENPNGKFDQGETCFTAIQSAINAAGTGDTIMVNPGIYDELLVIDKELTLRGANWGVHPAVGTHPTETVGTRGPESILSHDGFYAISPRADDITVDGFKFTGDGGRLIDTYEDANNFHLTNNIFENPEPHANNLIQLAGPSKSHTDVLIDYNLFQDLGIATFYFEGTCDRLHIAYNKFNGLGDSVFWSAEPLVDGIIEGNEFDGTIDEVPGVGFGTLNIGKGGNIIIRDNWFHDILYTGFQVGIIDGSVTGNTFERIYPYPGVGADAFQLWGGEWGTAISTDVLIEGNTINYNDLSTEDPIHGIRLRALAGVSTIDGSTIHIHDNNFLDGGYRTDAFAIRHQGDPETIVDAEMNYWSTAVESEIIEMFEGPVDYDPWFGKQPKVEETVTGDDTVDAIDEADTIVEKTGEGTPTVSVAEFTENPATGFSNDAGKYYDVKIDSPVGVESLTLKFYYTDADLGGIEESTLSMKWHDGSSWITCTHQTLHTVSDVSGYSGYIEILVTDSTYPSLSHMTGTPFGFEGEFPEVYDELCDLSVSGEVIVEAAEDVTYVYASMGDTAEITVELGLEGYHGDIYFTLYKKVDGGLAYVDEIRTVYGIELKGSRTASWVVTQSPGNYVIWINIDLMEKVQLTGLDEALHIGPIEVIIS